MDDPARPFRLAGPADLPEVEWIVREAYAPYIARIGRPPGPMLDDHGAMIGRGQVHLLTEGGATLGLVALVEEPDALLLHNVAVDPRVRGRGHGRRLIAFAEGQGRARALPWLRLYTHVLMSENLALYARLGFIETHRAREQGLDRVHMRKGL